ncbi:MAG: hypothetical protein ICPDIFCJ_00651 [Sodalis sp. Ppy]|nr:hypothetical protein [Sodalis sp. Ppy]
MSKSVILLSVIMCLYIIGVVSALDTATTNIVFSETTRNGTYQRFSTISSFWYKLPAVHKQLTYAFFCSS